MIDIGKLGRPWRKVWGSSAMKVGYIHSPSFTNANLTTVLLVHELDSTYRISRPVFIFLVLVDLAFSVSAKPRTETETHELQTSPNLWQVSVSLCGIHLQTTEDRPQDSSPGTLHWSQRANFKPI